LSSADSPTILFTSAGRRVELLRAFRQAYEGLELESNIVALDVDPLAPALRTADRSYLVPRLTDPAYIPTLVDICRGEEVKLVFPLIDPDITVLAEHRSEIEETGAHVACVCAEAAALAADKWRTTRFFERLGLAVPRSWLPEEIESAELSYPLFIKPRLGSAGKDAFRVGTEREMRFFLEYVPDPMVQELLLGPEITCDIICDLDGETLAVVARRRIEVRWGEVAKGVTVGEDRVIDACLKIARHLPAKGPMTAQCILRDGDPYFTEINARFGGGFPLAVAAGVDAPRWYVAWAAGFPIATPPIGSYRTGLYLTRFDDSYFLTEAEHARLASRHFRP
jgi:carbamoyl-phosphate synthase large subunit